MTEEQWQVALRLLYQAENEIITWNSMALGSYYYGNEVADRICAFLKELERVNG
jgi:hypothetical protein